MISGPDAQAFLTPTHLAIAMEYAPGGELFNYLVHERRFSENKVCGPFLALLQKAATLLLQISMLIATIGRHAAGG